MRGKHLIALSCKSIVKSRWAGGRDAVVTLTGHANATSCDVGNNCEAEGGCEVSFAIPSQIASPTTTAGGFGGGGGSSVRVQANATP